MDRDRSRGAAAPVRPCESRPSFALLQDERAIHHEPGTSLHSMASIALEPIGGHVLEEVKNGRGCRAARSLDDESRS